MRIIEYRSNDFYKRFAVDLFAFGYFMGGINFVDIAYLKTDNIVDGRLIYTRRKTHKLIRLPLQPKAQEIIERYRQDGALFLFPILSAFHKTEQQQRNRVHKVISKVNERLKEVGKELEIPDVYKRQGSRWAPTSPMPTRCRTTFWRAAASLRRRSPRRVRGSRFFRSMVNSFRRTNICTSSTFCASVRIDRIFITF